MKQLLMVWPDSTRCWQYICRRSIKPLENSRSLAQAATNGAVHHSGTVDNRIKLLPDKFKMKTKQRWKYTSWVQQYLGYRICRRLSMARNFEQEEGIQDILHIPIFNSLPYIKAQVDTALKNWHGCPLRQDFKVAHVYAYAYHKVHERDVGSAKRTR